MTRIDRYILTLFLRTVAICFCSLSGIFIVFHAFTSMDDLVARGQSGGGLLLVMAEFYGPYLLLLADSTGAIITLMALLFTAGWLRRTGELTAMLSAGVSHGRVFRPMVLAAIAIISLQIVNREVYLPKFAHRLSLKSKPAGGDLPQPILAQYDKVHRILIDGRSVRAASRAIESPSLRLDGDYSGWGDAVIARSARWVDAGGGRPSGYVLDGVSVPADIDSIAAVRFDGRPVAITRRDAPNLQSGQCFLASAVHSDLLMANESSRKLASVKSLIDRIRNPAVHSAASLLVRLHARLVRPPLDVALIVLILPLAAGVGHQNLFMMAAAALGTVLLFFAVKMVASAMGGSGYLLSPAMAGWLPLLLLGPVAYYRYRLVQTI